MLVLIVMIISIALLLALFSGFLPFAKTYGNIAQYSTAYYGAISAIERGALAIRYAGPGFDGESWRKNDWTTSQNTWKNADKRIENFYTYGDGRDTLLWKVHSSTDRIPSTWNGNVDASFVRANNSGSKNFNMLNYAKTELIPLGTVGTIGADDYYMQNPSFRVTPSPQFSLKGTFRLNPLLFQIFSKGNPANGKLCENNCQNTDHDWRNDNWVAANWTIKGKYEDIEYTLLPRESTSFGEGWGIINDRDTLLRAKLINSAEGLTLTFWGASNPIKNDNSASLNIISNKEGELKDKGNFTSILIDPKTTNSNLSFSLVNYLWSQGKNLYPFLEYEFHTTDGSKISDRFYTLQGEGKVWSYRVKLQVKKPTLEQPALGNFTIIF